VDSILTNTLDRRFWAVDKVILAYFAFALVLIVGWWSRIADAPWLLLANLAGGAALIYEVKRPNRTSWIFRNWYPLPYVGACYKEMALFIPAVRHTDADQWLANLDFQIWHAHPTVWLERIQSPGLTEFLQIIYTLFIPAVLLIPFLVWWRRRYPEFQYLAFLIALGFLASYIGYLIVPARGPRFLLRNLQHTPLQGLWLFHTMQSTLDRLESAHYDCFPSGHTELTILAWWGSRFISLRLFWLYFAYTLCIIFATVYLRYHYTVDVMAGAVVAAALILTAPVLYRKLSKGGHAIGRN
jgi:membrane-associated phospholipid phosphatase